jgi:hypothetical protein
MDKFDYLHYSCKAFMSGYDDMTPAQRAKAEEAYDKQCCKRDLQALPNHPHKGRRYRPLNKMVSLRSLTILKDD